ncbi:venom acid phosphatase Acph-1-like [Anoplophora glabripennis]|uniref:venom acid phosphatase Acph-1-like n=1 Tax=Anoplophora glabripennis TaxID=217634 RepID=UPI0008742EE8|nr:venom acid phosphatase Acph-1-like [Anoplophora glabripennis]
MKLAIFFVVFAVVACSSQETGDTLKLVHVFFRHGARTPESKDEYPNDPYKYETFLPMGWGQLTNYGKRQAYALGKNLRRRYGSFLGDIYTPELVHAQSTDYDRTKMSAILALAGMFPPAPSQQWDDTLNWLPIPISYERDHLDFTLRRPNHYCPAYLRELDRVLQSEQAKEYLKKNKNVLDYVEENSGRPMNKLMDVFSIYQTLTAERGMNLTLPEWSKSVYPHGITEIAAKQCELENSNKILKRLNGGRSLKMVVNNMLAKATHNLRPRERKIFLFSGHENNVINVLAAMDLYKAHFPSYSSAVIIELHYLSDEDEYAVKVFYVKNVNEEAEEKQLKGCEVLCPLTKFLEIVEPHLPLNYTAECESDIFLS